MKARNRDAYVSYRWCGKCAPPGVASELHSSGTNFSHNQRVSHSDLSFYSSHEVTWPHPHQWLLLVMSMSVTTVKTTEVNFQLKDVKYLSQISSASNMRFRHLGYSFHFKSLFVNPSKARFYTLTKQMQLHKTATQATRTPKQRHNNTATTHSNKEHQTNSYGKTKNS